MQSIVFFDDYCFLCSFLMRKLIGLKSFDQFYFAPLNGETYLKLSNQIYSKADAIEFYHDGLFYKGFSALVKIMQLSGSPKWITFILARTPNFIGNFIYKIIAKTRPKSDTCLIINDFHKRLLK